MADVDISAEAVERRATRIERYAEQRRSEAGNWARGSSLHTEVLAHAETIAGDAATLRALRAALTQAEAERDKGRTALRYSVWSVWIDHPSTQDIINMDAFDCARAALGDSA